jgi:hypothetical protein
MQVSHILDRRDTDIGCYVGWRCAYGAYCLDVLDVLDFRPDFFAFLVRLPALGSSWAGSSTTPTTTPTLRCDHDWLRSRHWLTGVMTLTDWIMTLAAWIMALAAWDHDTG